MSREKYTHVQVLLPEIRAMEAAGKTKREIAEHFGLRDMSTGSSLLCDDQSSVASYKLNASPPSSS